MTTAELFREHLVGGAELLGQLEELLGGKDMQDVLVMSVLLQARVAELAFDGPTRERWVETLPSTVRIAQAVLERAEKEASSKGTVTQ